MREYYKCFKRLQLLAKKEVVVFVAFEPILH